MYDHVLYTKLPKQATFTGYANEIGIVTVDKHLEDAVVWACKTLLG